MGEKKLRSMRIDEDIWNLAKARAKANRRSITDVLRAFLEHYAKHGEERCGDIFGEGDIQSDEIYTTTTHEISQEIRAEIQPDTTGYTALISRIDALEAKPTASADLEERLADLERRLTAGSQLTHDRLDTLEERLASTTQEGLEHAADLEQRLADLEELLADMHKETSSIDAEPEQPEADADDTPETASAPTSDESPTNDEAKPDATRKQTAMPKRQRARKARSWLKEPPKNEGARLLREWCAQYPNDTTEQLAFRLGISANQVAPYCKGKGVSKERRALLLKTANIPINAWDQPSQGKLDKATSTNGKLPFDAPEKTSSVNVASPQPKTSDDTPKTVSTATTEESVVHDEGRSPVSDELRDALFAAYEEAKRAQGIPSPTVEISALINASGHNEETVKAALLAGAHEGWVSFSGQCTESQIEDRGGVGIEWQSMLCEMVIVTAREG